MALVPAAIANSRGIRGSSRFEPFASDVIWRAPVEINRGVEIGEVRRRELRGNRIESGDDTPPVSLYDIRAHDRGDVLRGLQPASAPLDAANSGTTMRLMSGILAAHRMQTTIAGDRSLSRRPMQRVIDPLTRMGARTGGKAGARVTGEGREPAGKNALTWEGSARGVARGHGHRTHR